MKFSPGKSDFAVILGLIAVLIAFFRAPAESIVDASQIKRAPVLSTFELKEGFRIDESKGEADAPQEEPNIIDLNSGDADLETLLEAISTTKDVSNDEAQVGYGSVLKIFVTYVKPSFLEPWKSDSPEAITGSGFPIVFQGKKYVITNSHVAEFGADIRVRKPAASIKYPASLVVESKDLDLAVLVVESDEFWSSLIPLELQTEVPALAETVTVIGYPEGDDALCLTKGVVSRVKMTFARSGSVSQIQIDAAINSGNSGGPVFSAKTGRVVGVATSKLLFTDNIGFIVASKHIVQLLVDFYKHGAFQGLPSMGAKVRKLENAAHRRALSIPSEVTHGVRVIDLWKLGTVGELLKTDDVLLKIDGAKVGIDGTVPFLPTSSQRIDLSWLYSSKQCGDTISIEFMREGKVHEAEVVLKTTQFEIKSEYCRDHGNKYYVFGGFVFGVFSYEAVADTQDNNQYTHATIDSRFPDRYGFLKANVSESVVVLQILRHEVNHGYDDIEMRKIKAINGEQPISFEHAIKLLNKQKTVKIEFHKNEVCVFDREEALASNAEIMKTFNIPQISRMKSTCD